MCAIVIDVSWFWSNSLRMQRAADAAALAGVIRLPGREDLAIDLARAEAQKNGYTNGAGGVIVDVHKDAANNRRLRVKISGPVNTFFARVLGFNNIQETRDSQAEYVLPVPMGSPENYYGVYGLVRHCATTTTAPSACQTANGYTTFDDVHTPTVRTTDTGWLDASATKGTVNRNWTTTGQRLRRGQQPGDHDHQQCGPGLGQLRRRERDHVPADRQLDRRHRAECRGERRQRHERDHLRVQRGTLLEQRDHVLDRRGHRAQDARPP